MSFHDIKDPAKRATLVEEYITAMKTVKQGNMTNREMKLAIGGKLLNLFHPIVHVTKQAAEEATKEIAPLNHSQIGRVLDDYTLCGNRSICSRKICGY